MRTYKNMRPVDSVRLSACFETLSSFPNLSQRSNKSISRCVKGSGVVNASAFEPFDRHRGSGCPLTPATPPCVRDRTRRFEMVTLAHILQIREPERREV